MIWLLIACGSKKNRFRHQTTQSAKISGAGGCPSLKKEYGTIEPTVILDGVSIAVEWDDGDTFHGKTADGTKIKARLAGYNTLESYGPVHQWGDWTEKELYAFAKESGVFASKRFGNVQIPKKAEDMDGCLLIVQDCLRKAMLENGFAHPFSIGGPAPEADMQALRTGIENKAGIWAKGCTEIVDHFFAFTR